MKNETQVERMGNNKDKYQCISSPYVDFSTSNFII